MNLLKYYVNFFFILYHKCIKNVKSVIENCELFVFRVKIRKRMSFDGNSHRPLLSGRRGYVFFETLLIF